MVNFLSNIFSQAGHKFKLHAASDYVGVTSSAVAHALHLSLRDIVCNSVDPALQRLYVRDEFYGDGLKFAVRRRGNFNSDGTGFYRYINRKTVTLKLYRNYADPETVNAVKDAIYNGLGLRVRERDCGVFGDTCLDADYRQLLGAFRATDHEVFHRSFAVVENILSVSRDAARVAGRWRSGVNFSDVLLSSLANGERSTATSIASNDLGKFMEHYLRLPLRMPRFLNTLTPGGVDSAMQILADWDLPFLSYIGCGAFSMAFNTHPDPDGRQQVVVLSPDGEEWPDTPYHAPAYAYAPLAGGGHIRVMPSLPELQDTSISTHLSRWHLSSHDLYKHNIGNYIYRDQAGKMRSVTLVRDWGAGPTNLKENQRNGLWHSAELSDRIAVHARIAAHGIFGATRYIAPSDLNVPNADRVRFVPTKAVGRAIACVPAF